MGVRIYESGRGTLRILRLKAHQLSESPDQVTISAMEAALKVMYADTIVKTHVISGSLKATGHTTTKFENDQWTGTIIYGGRLFKQASPGPPPISGRVKYAIYEMNRGGTHDFYRDLPQYDPLFEKAFNSHFERHS